MSEMSGLQHAAPSLRALMPLPLPQEEPPQLSNDVQPHEVRFRRLRGAQEIRHVLHLRDEIRLPASALGDSGFLTREKKEMRSVWSALSSGGVNTSVPSGCCP